MKLLITILFNEYGELRDFVIMGIFFLCVSLVFSFVCYFAECSKMKSAHIQGEFYRKNGIDITDYEIYCGVDPKIIKIK